jgi:hypothetical protein
VAEATLQTWTFVWLITAAVVLIRHWRPGAGVGLVFTYVLSFGVMHWLAATIYLLPWYGGPRLDFTAAGVREAAIAMIAFAVGSEIALALLRRRHIEHAEEAEEKPVDGRLVTLYLVAGAVLYGVILPLASRLPSVTAFASAGSTLVIVGVSLKCWNSWVRGAGPRLWLWLAATSVFPLMTLITQGFLGYGFAAMLTIFAFVASIYRPRWRVIVAGLLLAYAGLSVYVTYMRDRSDIRAVVWAGGAVDERVTQVTDTFINLEWFDVANEEHLHRIDGRLNQDYLIGAAVAYIGDGSASFARGGTFWQAIVALIPRALWPNKPIVGGSGNLVSDYTGFRFADGTSVGIGQVMESYVNFGTAGVVVGFLLIGAALALTDRMSYLRLSQGSAYGFLLWYLPGLSLLQVGGSFMEVTTTAGAAIGVAVALNYFAPYLAPDRSRHVREPEMPAAAESEVSR